LPFSSRSKQNSALCVAGTDCGIGGRVRAALMQGVVLSENREAHRPVPSFRRHKRGDNQIDRARVLEVRIQPAPGESLQTSGSSRAVAGRWAQIGLAAAVGLSGFFSLYSLTLLLVGFIREVHATGTGACGTVCQNSGSWPKKIPSKESANFGSAISARRLR
jgi:hypothetical protein